MASQGGAKPWQGGVATNLGGVSGALCDITRSTFPKLEIDDFVLGEIEFPQNKTEKENLSQR